MTRKGSSNGCACEEGIDMKSKQQAAKRTSVLQVVWPTVPQLPRGSAATLAACCCVMSMICFILAGALATHLQWQEAEHLIKYWSGMCMQHILLGWGNYIVCQTSVITVSTCRETKGTLCAEISDLEK